ncbi:hypothetical protein [Actinoplanes lobatus]|uniref:Uncharacterized protein n=1 Tax=Actinoplanes lobatus TaxID=113568 RepID=A0A7W7MJH9_9ACTN|nr:hypothetical protein [Actinoplanes lobatus]MBB4752371.1 hypothetical protein [Actinoplanes lobatus]
MTSMDDILDNHPHLRWRLFEPPCGWHPYVQVAAALGRAGTRG